MSKTRRRPHRIAVVALDGVVPFDLTTPVEIFTQVTLPSGAPGYQVRVCGVSRDVDAGAFRIQVKFALASILRADTIILPGVANTAAPVPSILTSHLRRAARRGARIASICTGAFVLAATGLLHGKTATTHWLAAGELARRFPQIHVDPNVLFVDQGNVLTSAGASAGIDLCLHLIRRDYGATVAATAARLVVMPLERDGGQAQFIQHATPTDDVPLSRVLSWLEQHLDDPAISLQSIAQHGAVSVRTLTRQFKAQLGTTPLQWLQRARVIRAQMLLETTALSVDRVAESSGFGSAASLRVHFNRVAGTSPQAYRRAFQSRG